MFFPLFTLCSGRVCVLVIVLSDSLCERIGKWETCPILKEGTDHWYDLAEASVTKTATLLGVLTVTVSKVMSAYMIHRKTSSMKMNGG
jgi:hypothetical protein